MKILLTLISISFCILLIALSSFRVQAQSLYEIEGAVYESNSAPLSGMAVFLEDLTRSRIGQSITDSDGRYHFSRVAAGAYYLVVQPNDKEYRASVNRIELLNTSSVGSNSAVEHVDITLTKIPRRAEASAVTLFAQEVPPAAIAEYEQGLVSIEKKNSEIAIRQLNGALKIFPNYFLASQQLGLLYVESEQYQKAIGYLVKAVEINPKAGASYLALGIASLKLGRADLAIDALQRARKLDDKSFRVHFFLGLAFLELGRSDEAENSLKESYKLGGPSKIPSARLHLASIYSKQGKRIEAINELEGYLRDNPKAANAESVRQALTKLRAKQ